MVTKAPRTTLCILTIGIHPVSVRERRPESLLLLRRNAGRCQLPISIVKEAGPTMAGSIRHKQHCEGANMQQPGVVVRALFCGFILLALLGSSGCGSSSPVNGASGGADVEADYFTAKTPPLA